jgi:hypothetical protein
VRVIEILGDRDGSQDHISVTQASLKS